MISRRHIWFLVAAWLAAVLGVCAADIPEGLLAEARGDVFVLPAYVQHVRVLDDGTWVVATHGDPESRRGLVDGIRWVPGDELAEAGDVEPVASYIGRDGMAWFRSLDASLRSFWLLSNGERVEQLRTSTRFVGVPWESRAGDVWTLAEGTVFRRAVDGATERFALAAGARVLAQNGFRDGPAGSVLLWGSLPLWRTEADEMLSVNIWRWTPRINGLVAHSTETGFTCTSAIVDPNGHMIFTGTAAHEAHSWVPNGAIIPEKLTQLVSALGGDTHAGREAASQELRAHFGSWMNVLKHLEALAVDPEVKERLAAITSSSSQAITPSSASNVGRGLPLSSRVLVPRCLGGAAGTFCMQARDPLDLGDPRSGRWTVFQQAVDGSLKVIADKLPTDWAPSAGLVSEQVGAFDLVQLDRRTWAWRNGLGHLTIFRDGKRLLPAGIVSANPAFPLPQCRILSTWENGLLVRLHRQVLAVSFEALDRAKVEANPAPIEVDEALSRRTAIFVKAFQTYYESDMTQEQIADLADKMLQRLPNYKLGFHVRGNYRAEVDLGSRLVLEDLDRAQSLYRNTGSMDELVARADAWGNLKQYREQVRDLNHLIEVQAFYNGVGLSSMLLLRGNAWLEAEEWAPCLRDFRAAVKHNPNNQVARNNIAWVLCTSPDPAFRDAKEAIRLATLVCEIDDFESAYCIDTLAAAYAEAGDFAKAIEMQQKAMALIDPDDEEERWTEFQAHLKLFRAKKPVRIPEPSIVVEKDEKDKEDEGL